MRMTLLVLIAFLVTGPAVAQEQGNAKAGEELAMASCSNCHLVAEGQKNHPMDSVPSFDAIAANRSLTADRLRTFLYKPHWPMPDFGLSRQQVEDEVAFIFELRRRRASQK